MSQIHDELAARAMLTDLTEGQPPAPPDRYGAVRHRAVLHRRRQLAAIAAVIAVLAAAAATIPLRLLHPVAPTAPNSYHLSEQPPPRGARPGLIATGTIDGRHWQLSLAHESGSLTGPHGTGMCITIRPSSGMGSCMDGHVQSASRTGTPASTSLGQQWGPGDLYLGTVRSDVATLAVRYTNGQTLALYPVAVFGARSASYVVLPTPHPDSIVSVTAYDIRGNNLGYAIPFDQQGLPVLSRWLRAGQRALPRPASRVVGSGSIGGTSWTERVSIGPWGTCLYGSGGGSACAEVTGTELSGGEVVGPVGGISIQDSGVQIYPGEAAPSVSYLIVTLRDHSTVRVPTVSVGGRRFFACADVRGDRIVRWAAYDAAGHLVGRSKPGQIP